MRINKVILGGRLTSDPELKQSTNGLSVCSFSIAVDRKFSKGEEKGCDFINVTAWRQQAEFVTRYFKKGSCIIVCGSLQTRNWTDNQGNKRYATEVVADEVSFGGAVQNAEGRGKNNTSSTAGGPPSPAGEGSYMPSAYTQGQMNFNPGPEFEEIPGDEQLPF